MNSTGEHFLKSESLHENTRESRDKKISDIVIKEEPESETEDSSVQQHSPADSRDYPTENMVEQRELTEDEESDSGKIPHEDECGDAETQSNSKGSVLGRDYTVKETPVDTPVDVAPAKGRKRRYRKKIAKTYYCAHCDFNSPRWDRLKEHLIVHLEDRPFVCEICDFKTKTAKKLKRHQMVHSQERKFECHLCQLTFKRAHTLKEHVLTHSKEKLFFCSVCDYSTHRSQYLKRHMMKHTNDTLQCDYCQFKTVYATLLRRHLQIHTGKKIYKCQLCNYSSVYLHCVSQHRRTHETDTLYECGVCEFKTSKHSSLRTHMYMHANKDRKTKCDFCNYASVRRCDVKRHREKVHKELVALEHEKAKLQDNIHNGDKEIKSEFVEMDTEKSYIDEEGMMDGVGWNGNCDDQRTIFGSNIEESLYGDDAEVNEIESNSGTHHDGNNADVDISDDCSETNIYGGDTEEDSHEDDAEEDNIKN